VQPGSPAAAGGLTRGDRVVKANGRLPLDYIDYRYLTAAPGVSLLVDGRGGAQRRIVIEKHEDEDLGLRFEQDVFDGVRTCRNRCPFCFVSQLPSGLRRALYVRDDDYRLSFLHGNFITLTNLTPADRRRIVRLHLCPLYISVHATEPEVRRRLFGRTTTDPVAEMRRLAAKGIGFHTQIVVCPGVNDGEHLERTVADLAALHPGIRSVGVVPVGITKYRLGLPRLRAVTPRIAAELVGRVEAWQRLFRKRLGTRLVFAADELYLGSRLPIPSRAHYEGFCQLGNGIGGVRVFLDELAQLRPPKLRSPLSVILVTGEMAAAMVTLMAEKLQGGGLVTAEVCVVRNRFLGRSVTTAGLLCGADIARAVARLPRADVVAVPGTAVREDEGFLDGVTVEELSQQLGATVLAVRGPRDAVGALEAFARQRGGA
jgi:putative radical SAM enzyme (TIGR03279 family)